MKRRGAITFGCVFAGVGILLVLVVGWRCLDFFILRPAGVKSEINDTYDHIRGDRHRLSLAAKRDAFRTHWNNNTDTTDNIEITTKGLGLHFEDDTVVFQYSDTLHFPFFGRYGRTFRVCRLFK